MLDLSRVTLLFVETRAHMITERVIGDCLEKADFGGVLVYTDKLDAFPMLEIFTDARIIRCEDFPNKKLAGKFYYSEAMQEVTTDFALLMEWDAGIFDPSKFLPEFFDYDYIGAPWNVGRGSAGNGVHDVGNGGFALMSKRLGRRIHQDRQRFPCYTDMDVSRQTRTRLEPEGFKWAPRDLAGKFSWELVTRDPEHFGFHGAFNWPTVLPKEEIILRAKLMLQNDYTTLKLRDLYRTAPWIVEEFTPEELARFSSIVPPSHLARPRIPGMMSPQQRNALQLMQAHRRGPILPRIEGLKA